MKGGGAIRLRAAVAVIRRDEILLVEHEKGGRRYFLLPGGGVEFGEEIRRAAARELQEETGLRATVGRLFLVSESIPPDRHRHVVNFYFAARLRAGGRLRKRTPRNERVLVGFAWKKVSELPGLAFYPEVQREIVSAWRERFRGPLRFVGNRWRG